MKSNSTHSRPQILYRRSAPYLVTVLLLACALSAIAQTQTPTPSPAQGQLKYLNKISHWVSAYAMSNPDFMEIPRDEFKAASFAVVYIEGTIEHNAWTFTTLNKVTQLRYENKTTPNILFSVKFKPKDEAITSYEVLLSVLTSDDIKTDLSKIVSEAATKHLKGKTYPDPGSSVTDLTSALQEAMTGISAKLGKTLAPQLMVRYNNEVFWNGHEISLLSTGGNTLELEAIDKDGKTIPSSDLKWTNADPYQSKGVVDMTGVNSKVVTLTQISEKATINLTVKRVDLQNDINELLKRLIVEALTAKRKEALDTIGVLRKDSVANTAKMLSLIAKLESNNFPMEGDGSTLTPMFTAPIKLADSTRFRSDQDRINSFYELRKRQMLANKIRRKVNVAAFADLVVDKPEKVKELVEDLLQHSGTLIARLILNKDSKGQQDEARNIVVEYLNANLERLASRNYNPLTSHPPVPRPQPVTVTPPTIQQGKYLYVSSYVPDKTLIENRLVNYLDSLAKRGSPLYVFVNYSQDVSRASYLARVTETRPKGLPVGARFKVYTIVHVPGSIEEEVFKGGTQSGEKEGNASNGIVEDVLTESTTQDDEESALAATFFGNGWEECFKGLKSVTSTTNFENRKELPVVKLNTDCYGGALFQLATGELLWRTPNDHGNSSYYILYQDERKWQPFTLPPLACTSCDMAWLVKQVETTALRYLTPIEDVIVVIDGKDLDGVESSQLLSAVFLLVDIVPGGKIFRPVKKIGQAGLKGTRKLLITIGKTSKAYIGEVVDGVYKPYKWIKQTDKIDEVLEVTEEVTYLAEDGVQRVGKLEVVRKGSEYGVRVLKTIVTLTDEINDVLARLKGKAKYVLDGTGEYGKVGGHHPVAKVAFEGDLIYDYKKAFSVPGSELDKVAGVDKVHAFITGQQNSLYTAWRKANPTAKLTIDIMADIEIKAMKNVGVPEDIATGWVIKALDDLKAQGVTAITNIPWNGVN